MNHITSNTDTIYSQHLIWANLCGSLTLNLYKYVILSITVINPYQFNHSTKGLSHGTSPNLNTITVIANNLDICTEVTNPYIFRDVLYRIPISSRNCSLYGLACCS